MAIWMEQLPEKMLQPIVLILWSPLLWIGSFIFTQNFFGSLILYAWLSILFTSFLLLLVRDLYSDWKVMAYLNVLFFVSLFQVLLYVSLRMERLLPIL